MKKYLSFMAFAMMAVFSLTLVSCGDDDDDEPSIKGNQIEVNGKKYALSDDYSTGVMWNEPPIGSAIQFVTGTKSNDMIFTFGFVALDDRGENYIEPKVGLDVAKIHPVIYDGDGKVELLDFPFSLNVADYGDTYDKELEYESGSLIITSIDKANEIMTLKFSNLKMSNSGESYTLNGTIQLNFTD